MMRRPSTRPPTLPAPGPARDELALKVVRMRLAGGSRGTVAAIAELAGVSPSQARALIAEAAPRISLTPVNVTTKGTSQ